MIHAKRTGAATATADCSNVHRPFRTGSEFCWSFEIARQGAVGFDVSASFLELLTPSERILLRAPVTSLQARFTQVPPNFTA
jgi:hypothetical protein